VIQGSLLYANLGIRGLTTREVRDGQLARALAMKPDLVTLFTGTNDVLARHFDAGQVGADLEEMEKALIQAGATVLTFTLPDLAPVMPLARFVTPRVLALNRAMRTAALASRAILVDIAQYPVATDRRMWSRDRIHANPFGHARIARALAHALRLEGSDGTWAQPLPEEEPRPWWVRSADELAWMGRYLVPWMVLSAAGRLIPRPPRKPKRPELAPLP